MACSIQDDWLCVLVYIHLQVEGQEHSNKSRSRGLAAQGRKLLGISRGKVTKCCNPSFGGASGKRRLRLISVGGRSIVAGYDTSKLRSRNTSFFPHHARWGGRPTQLSHVAPGAWSVSSLRSLICWMLSRRFLLLALFCFTPSTQILFILSKPSKVQNKTFSLCSLFQF